MSCVAISNGRRALQMAGLPAGQLMARGTLLAEFRFTAEDNRQQIVANLDRTVGWVRKFKIALCASGRLTLDHRQGSTTSHGVLDFDPPDRDATLRISYCWHAPDR